MQYGTEQLQKFALNLTHLLVIYSRKRKRGNKYVHKEGKESKGCIQGLPDSLEAGG